MTVSATKAGYKTQTKSVDLVSADATLNFALAVETSTPSYTLSGFVTEDGVASGTTAGDPISGATVLVTDGPHANKSATTGSDGSYQIAEVSGAMNVSVTKSGYISQTKSATVTANTTLDFSVGKEILTYSISGYVREAAAGSGSGGYIDNSVGGFGRGARGGISGERSREREQIDPGMRAAGYQFEGPPDTAAATDDPIAGAVIKVTDGPHIDKQATTARDGSYTLSGLSGTMSISVSKAGYITSTSTITVVSTSVVDFALVVEVPTYTLSGLITEDGVASDSTAGTPVSGATVLVTDGPYANKQATTGSDGSYQIADVSGTMNVLATKSGFTSQTKSATVTANTTLDFSMGRQTWALYGGAFDIITTAPIPDLVVAIEGVGTYTTNAAGFYGFPTLAAGTWPITISGNGYITRTTYAITDGIESQASLWMIPDGGGFNLAFYDEVFRTTSAGSGRGAKQWEAYQPTFVFWMQKFKCIEYVSGASDRCAKAEALDESISGSWFELVMSITLYSDVHRLTGNLVSGTQRDTREFTPGTVIDLGIELYNSQGGTVNLIYMDYPDGPDPSTYQHGTNCYSFDSGPYNGEITRCNVVMDTRGEGTDYTSFSHELAHVLGFNHPFGYDFSQYGGSVMGHNTYVTAQDILHGRIMYMRPPGSRTPDIDPSWYDVSIAGQGGNRGGRGTEELTIFHR
jgi:hypothetical protein